MCECTLKSGWFRLEILKKIKKIKKLKIIADHKDSATLWFFLKFNQLKFQELQNCRIFMVSQLKFCCCFLHQIKSIQIFLFFCAHKTIVTGLINLAKQKQSRGYC